MEEGNIKRQITISGVLVALISVILVFVSGVIYASIKEAQEKDAQKYMTEIVSQYKNIMTAQINGDIQTLEALSTFIAQSDTIDLEFTLSRLEAESTRNNFVRMGFVTLEHTGYFIETDGKKYYDIDIGDEAFVKDALSGESVVSEVMEDKLSDDKIICYGVPVTHKGKIIGALTATRFTSIFSEMISREIFDGIAYLHIIDQEGNFIIRSQHAVIDKQMDNIFDEGEVEEDTQSSVLSDMEKGGDSFTTFRYKGEAYWTVFIPIGINGWQIFCLVPQTFLNHNFNTLLLVFLCVMSAIFLLFIILFFYIYSILKKGQKTLQILAFKDVLTGADNRNRFVTDLPALLQEPLAHAMVLMNISGFKFVNEFFGFEKGNLLLRHISSVLQGNMEEGERYYRDNADHFGMLLYYNGNERLISRIQKIQYEINDYTVSPNQDYRVNCSFGVNIIQPEPGNKSAVLPDAVLNGALLALNSVNGNMSNPIAFYDKAIHEKARKKIEIESQMHAALANKEFHMYLQPKYYLDDKTLHSAEALVRWCTEDGVIHYPDEFIPVFEENGFITELDMFMLEEACRLVSSWIEKGLEVRPVSVNQSRIFFYDEDYLDKFHEIVDKYNIEPSMIILEVTESVAMSNLEQVKMVIKKLHKMGFSISMDDFGSGYSSLNTLKDLDIAELKLDKEFLSEQSTSPRGKVVIESMIHLARALSITTVAEGIENEVQLEFLKRIKCDIGQGFYFAKPMPVEEFENTILRLVSDK
ncbi:MAG: EAL domain-containing protein [Eubacteriales bacterium]|nr:EAL domain-containing protein [Eubacteriales bacterium]